MRPAPVFVRAVASSVVCNATLSIAAHWKPQDPPAGAARTARDVLWFEGLSTGTPGPGRAQPAGCR